MGCQRVSIDAGSFGNWFVDLQRGSRTLRLVKDRSQFMLAGPPTQAMRDAGLWRAFDSFEKFSVAIRNWAFIEADQK
jgi:hypothetical protein